MTNTPDLRPRFTREAPPPGGHPLAQHIAALGHLLDLAVTDTAARDAADVHLAAISRFTAPQHFEQRVAVALDVIQDHRRIRNVRGCTGCDWRPERPGYASDPDATIRRHQQFNRHLAELIVSVTG